MFRSEARSSAGSSGDDRGTATQFAYLGLSPDLITETQGGTPTKSYTYTPAGERLSQTTATGPTAGTGYYTYNGHADVEAVTGASGATTATYGYTAYGQPDPAQFTGADKTTTTTPSATAQPYSPVASLRTHWHIPCHQPSGDNPSEGELVNVTQAARELKIAPSTLLRWLDDGFVAGEQVTPGAPWRIRLTDQLRGMLPDSTPDGWIPLAYATQALGVSRQTVLQKVKRGELRAVLTRTGRRKGLRIELPTAPIRLSSPTHPSCC